MHVWVYAIGMYACRCVSVCIDQCMYLCQYVCMYIHTCITFLHAHTYVCTYAYMCHEGVVFQTIKSFICALGIYLQMTEATNK